MSLSPFEIRLELVKMAKDMLLEDWNCKRDLAMQEWHAKVAVKQTAGASDIPPIPPMPNFPSDSDITQMAGKLKIFIDNRE